VELFAQIRSWDWRELTFRAVAERAGVGERTVYRNFPTEAELRYAIGRRIEQQAGVTYDELSLGNLPEVGEQVLTLLPDYSTASPVHEHDLRRRNAFRKAVASSGKGFSAHDRELAAVALDLTWSVVVYERMLRVWNLDSVDAIQVMRWLHQLVTDAIEDGHRPTARQNDPSEEARSPSEQGL
jgi:AcrR family transcriptional regulator